MPRPAWLNRTVVGAGLTSFLADVGYELAVALLPSFLLALHLTRDAAALALGAIEAAAEFVSNAAKLAVGWYSDRVGRRKELVVFGYALTGSAFALCAAATGWPLVLLAKALGWLGKGVRGPLRNALLADAVDPAHHGKAFGVHRAADSLGSVTGPLIAAAILWFTPAGAFPDPTTPYRIAFLGTLLPGLGSAVAFALLVRERRFAPKPGLRLGASVRALPGGYRRFLVGVALFGVGDFAPTLMVLAATAALAGEHGTQTAAVVGVLLYAWRNLVQTVAAFPAGWLGDRYGHRRVLAVGYAVGALAMARFGLLLTAPEPAGLVGWLGAFALVGVYMATQEALEPAVVPALVPDRRVLGTAFGVLAVVNGLADVAASLTAGVLFREAGPAAGFAFAAGMMALGAAWVWRTAGPR